MAVLFNIFMRQTLANYFGGLHESMNCAFPLNYLNILKYAIYVIQTNNTLCYISFLLFLTTIKEKRRAKTREQ